MDEHWSKCLCFLLALLECHVLLVSAHPAKFLLPSHLAPGVVSPFNWFSLLLLRCSTDRKLLNRLALGVWPTTPLQCAGTWHNSAHITLPGKLVLSDACHHKQQGHIDRYHGARSWWEQPGDYPNLNKSAQAYPWAGTAGKHQAAQLLVAGCCRRMRVTPLTLAQHHRYVLCSALLTG